MKAELAGEQSTLGIGWMAGEMDDWISARNARSSPELKAELANAEERDKLDAQLAIARTKLDAYEGQAPKATASLGPITPAFALLGLAVTTPQEALAAVFIALTELGSLFGGAVFVSGKSFAAALQDGAGEREIVRRWTLRPFHRRQRTMETSVSIRWPPFSRCDASDGTALL